MHHLLFSWDFRDGKLSQHLLRKTFQRSQRSQDKDDELDQTDYDNLVI